jgi:BON domain-containing protein
MPKTDRRIQQSNSCTEVEQAVEQQIQERTHRRVGDLHVEAHDGQVVVRGQTRTYYVKQLAQVAALEVLGAGRTLVNDIQVA